MKLITHSKPTKEQKRMMRIVKKFQKYVATYSKQLGYSLYSDETFLDDMLYGIGISFSDKFKWDSGYRKWKKILMEYFQDSKLNLGNK